MPFTDGEHLRTWNTFDQLIQLIDYYLANEAERKQIAKQGEQFVRENYTFDNMIKNLIEIYEQV
jgi:spore maturation protein CgeB